MSIKHFKTEPRWKDQRILYNYGIRKVNIIHSRLRVGCSSLNYDLCINLRVKDSPLCSCGAPQETAKHFFMECPNFVGHRTELFNTVSNLTKNDVDVFLYGNQNISLEDNLAILECVQKFILDKKRFVV